MIIYLACFIILAIFSFLELQTPSYPLGKKLNSDTKYHFFVFIGLTIILFIIGAFRWEIGTDWKQYLINFNSIQQISYSEMMKSYGEYYGYGYLLFTYVFSHIFSNYSVYLFACCLLVFILTYSSIYNYSEYPIVSVFALFGFSFGYAFAVPRHGIALAFALFSFRYIYKRDLFKFLFCIGLACIFHNTAIFAIFAYWIYDINFNIKRILKIFPALLVISISINRVLGFITSINILPLSMSIRLQEYITPVNDFSLINKYTDILIRVITRGFILFLIYFIYKDRKKSKYYNGIISIYLFGVALYILCFNLNEVFLRIANFYEDMSQYFIISSCFANMKLKSNKYIFFCIIFVYLLLKFLARLILGYHEAFVPYKMIF